MYSRQCARSSIAYPEPNTLRKGSIITRAHFLLYPTVVCLHILVPVLFWSFVYKSSNFTAVSDWWTTISFHAVEGLMILVEIALNRMPFRWQDVFIIVIVGLLYTFWMWVVHAL